MASFAFCEPAHAQLANQPQSLDFEVTGLVPPACSVTTGDIGEQITRALVGAQPGERRQLNFGLDCNKPFRVRVQSANGGLMVAGMSQADKAAALRDGLQPILDYAVGLDLPYRSLQGSDERLTTVCATSILLQADAPMDPSCALGGQGGVLVPGLSVNRPGVFMIDLATPERPLVAGRLSDTIVITIESVR